MHARRQAGMPPLAIVLPHPPLPRRRSSLLSAGSCGSPHTPRSCGSPSSSLFFASTNRNSSDSWNSSVQDAGDDAESEWKPEHTLLLQRTLDALPSHLVSPFSGQIPPPNLLEKIARRVADAKGAEWTHSIRATRIKLIEIARARAAEAAMYERQRKYIPDENDEFACCPEEDGEMSLLKRPSTYATKRPLYRQSSMDFITSSATNLRDNKAISQLSNLIQRNDRMIDNPSFHPYSRHSRTRSQINRRSSPPPQSADVPSLLSPSSTTLNSSSSALHHSRSTLSSMSTSDSLMSSNRNSGISSSSSVPEECKRSDGLLPSAIAVAPNRRVQIVRRSESFCSSSPSLDGAVSMIRAKSSTPLLSSRKTVKRAPSYGAVSQEAKIRGEMENNDSSLYPSSDEEEKERTKSAKRLRMKSGTPPPSSDKALPALPTSPKVRKAKNSTSNTASPRSPKSKEAELGLGRPSGKPRMNLQRNPSMLGEELPPISSSSSTPESPSSPGREKILRRVKRLPPSRKIEFGQFAGKSTDSSSSTKAEGTLGSAFQLS